MESDTINQPFEKFESHAQITESDIEYWLARERQHLLGCSKWSNFLNVLSKAKTACDVLGNHVQDHFVDAGKMVSTNSWRSYEIQCGMAIASLKAICSCLDSKKFLGIDP